MANRKKNLSDKEISLLRDIGEKLKKLRKDNGFSNYENFAFEKGLNRSQYGKYETGAIDIQITTLLRVIEKHDGMTIEKFFKDLGY